MGAADVIRTKRDGGLLGPAEWRAFAAGAAAGTWEPPQLAAMLMAVALRGLLDPETAELTRALAATGGRLDLGDLPGVKVGLASTGGVGDATEVTAAALAAACGVVVPGLAGRGLGHTGGTLDRLGAVPGFRADLPPAEFRKLLKRVGVVVASPTAELAPATRVLDALRDVTATAESAPLVAASVLSRALAAGVSAVVVDVKCGRGALAKSRPEARKLARLLAHVGRLSGLAVEAVVTAMDAPPGREVGNAGEVAEAVGVLEGRVKGPLAELSVLLAARAVKLAGLAKTEAAATRQVRRALDSGAGLAKFAQFVAAQGGDLKALARLTPHPAAEVLAVRDGRVTGLDAELVGRAAMLLGAGRARLGDAVDPLAGVTVVRHVGDAVQVGEPVFLARTARPETLREASALLSAAVAVGTGPPKPTPLVLEEITP